MITSRANSNRDTKQAYSVDPRVSAVKAQSPFAYYRINDNDATLVDLINGFNITQTGFTWVEDGSPFGGYSADLDGTTDYANAYTAGASALWNPALCSVLVGIKIESATWTDSTSRYIVQMLSDADNRITIQKRSGNNELIFQAELGGVTDNVLLTGVTSTDWLFYLYGVSDAANDDVMTVWQGGAQVGQTTGLGTADATGLNSSNTALGSQFGISASSAFKGGLIEVAFFNKYPDAGMIALTENP